MMASKYIYDEGTDDEVYNDEWAASVDQEVCDVNKMETNFLQAMDWRLFVHPEEFEETLDAIEKQLALKEGLKRGWFTYAELDVLMGPDLIGLVWSGIASEVSKLLASLAAAYVTSVVSMVGSVALATQVSCSLSSATVALVALHSAPLTQVANLLHTQVLLTNPTVRLCGDQGGTDPCQGMVEIGDDSSLVVDSDWQKINHSDVMEAKVEHQPTSAHRNPKALWSPLKETGSGFKAYDTKVNTNNTENLNLRAGDKDGDHTGSRYQTGSFMEEENQHKAPTLSPPLKLAKSSVWSLWFLDSLLSQIWSLSTLRAQPAGNRPMAACSKQRRIVKPSQDCEVNLQDGKTFAGGLNYDLMYAARSKLAFDEGREKLCNNCFDTYSHSGSALKVGNRLGSHDSTRSSTFETYTGKDCSLYVTELCKGIFWGFSGLQSGNLLLSPDKQSFLHGQIFQDFQTKCSLRALSRESNFYNYPSHVQA
ncbi:protein CNPPD1-like [Elysia marginata]|uniref:Protein CNPPD1 n=1 Tax=Elysia marginata TaxID=1093978 RepID=A0AAV4FCR2_9GAST|nr:protein CNPPD1-like [Elysia marginata]